jgi:hypothetical protein
VQRSSISRGIESRGSLGSLSAAATGNREEELIVFVGEGQMYRLALIGFLAVRDSSEEKESFFSSTIEMPSSS